MHSFARYFPESFQAKLFRRDMNSSPFYNNDADSESTDESVDYCKIDEKEDIDYAVQEGYVDILTRNKKQKQGSNIYSKKFMLNAKIRALEEYVQHLEIVIGDQTTYIDYLEEKKNKLNTLKRWNSI